MDSTQILNIVTICISMILSLGAIILSFIFYQISNKQNKETALIQKDIKNAIDKLDKLYSVTFTDTFGALKNQMTAMQKHIFSSSVGDTNTTNSNNLRLLIFGCVSEKSPIEINELYKIVEEDQTHIKDTVYQLHQEKMVLFDGKTIELLKSREGEGSLDELY